MRSTIVILVTLSAFTTAHLDLRDFRTGLPKLVGGRSFVTNLKGRNGFLGAVPSVIRKRFPVQAERHLETRLTQVCGSGVGSCDAGYCCSAAGYCGNTPDYCSGPSCQFQYGPGCDANKVPAGDSTSNIARPKIGSIPYGGVNTAGIQDCTKPNVIAFSFDDGPYLYTKDLLDLLDSYGAKATFFITGNNMGKGEIDNCSTGYPQLIKRMYNSGHQVASHTWTHQNLSSLTTSQFNNQMYYNEMAFRNILGVIPTYMRPPYSQCGTACSDMLKNMGYHVTYFDLDTQGYLNDGPVDIQNSKDIFTNALSGVNPAQNDFLLIEHDIQYQTVYNLTKFMLDIMIAAGWGVPVTVGSCLGDPQENWYRSAGTPIITCAAGTYTGTGISSTPSATSTVNSASSSTVATTTATSSSSKSASTDGSCGGSITCLGSPFGNCCSQFGYCGSSTSYCGAGCQSAFGSCGLSSSLSSSPSSSTSTSSSSSISTSPSSSTSTTSSSSSTSTTSSSSSTSGATAKSTDGSCAGAGKQTCLNSGFGNCCSQYGWCGSTAAYCGTGCQAGFGTCS